MSKTRIQPKDEHWPPTGVRDLGSKEPRNAGPLVVSLGDLIKSATAKTGR